MNVLKALASIISMCNLHVILLSKITPRYFTIFTNGIFRPFNVRGESEGLFRDLVTLSQGGINTETGPPGWGLDARLATLFFKKYIVAKSKEVKTGSNLAEFCKEELFFQ
jgi:hypothetical protein